MFSKEKKGVWAVIPGFINYFYKEGGIPGHTKSAFNEYKMLTVHNLIVLNALQFMQKVNNFPLLLPPSIRLTISEESPVVGSSHETCENWLRNYNNRIYRK